MSISRNLADALHTVVENLPIREESVALALHKAVEADTHVAESDPGVGYDEAQAATDE